MVIIVIVKVRIIVVLVVILLIVIPAPATKADARILSGMVFKQICTQLPLPPVRVRMVSSGCSPNTGYELLQAPIFLL